MKTLILCGSPRSHGDTHSLVDVFLRGCPGEALLIDAYRESISPCIDCRWCWTHGSCAIPDRMQEVYAFIQDCDCVLIASPLYFSELTGRLLDVGSRLQPYFCARHFRQEELIPKKKRGAVILVGGGDGSAEPAYNTACTLLHHMRCTEIFPPVVSHDTNHRPALEDEAALSGLRDILRFFTQP